MNFGVAKWNKNQVTEEMLKTKTALIHEYVWQPFEEANAVPVKQIFSKSHSPTWVC